MSPIPPPGAALFATLAVLTTSPLSAGLVRFTATINAAQTTNGSTSAATGSAVMLYDVTANRFDLAITLHDFGETLNDSHIHVGSPGVPGGVSEPIGPEANYTRSGNSLTGTFANVEYSGDPATLLAGGTYLNFHTTPWPGGEVRGQLIPDPVRLHAVITAGQQTSNPIPVTNAFGAAQATYRPADNTIDVLVFIYNFTNTFTNSHFHEAPAGVAGGVVTGLGGAAAYTRTGNTYTQNFANLTYGGSPVALLSEGAYLNFHSNVYAPGEIRGQLHVADRNAAARLVNVSARGRVGTGDDVLITGLVAQGPGPVRVLIVARGPGLAAFGVAGALADTVLDIRDAAGRLLMANDNVASTPHPALVAASGFAPGDSAESAALLLLPPGAYTGVISGAGGATGVALAEAFEVAW